MSEFVSSLLAGSMPMEAGQVASNQFSDVGVDSEASDFASLFADMDFASLEPETPSADTPAALSDLMDPLLTGSLASSEQQNPAQNDPLQAAMLQQSGNALPSSSPSLAISGFSAQAVQNGAAAISFAADGKQLLTTGPQYASSVGPAIQQSQAQLRDMTQSNGFMLQDMEVLAVPKVELGKQTDLLALLPQQSGTSPTDALTNLTGQQPSQALLGLQGATEFSNVLAASTRTPEPMTATLNQPQWKQQVGDRIAWMISQGLRQADIRLNPPELGMLEVRVQMQGDQASIQFNTAHAEVKEALDSALPRLREMLAENGLELADVNVSQQGQQQTKQGEESDSNQSSTEPTAEAEIIADSHEIKTISGNGVIDYYA